MSVLWIYGPTGSGKTRLVKMLVQERETEGKKVLVLSCESLGVRLLDLLRRRQTNVLGVLTGQFSEVDTLVVEEMEGWLYKHVTQEVIEELIGRLSRQGKEIVCTSLYPPENDSKLQQLPDFNITEKTWPDERERKRIVEELCRELDLKLREDEKEEVIARAQHAGQIRGMLLKKKIVIDCN